jgi:hypothetical protein
MGCGKGVVRRAASRTFRAMTFEFLIAWRKAEGFDLVETLAEVLQEALEGNLNDADAVTDMIAINHERLGDEEAGPDGGMSKHALTCFAVVLPDETASPEAVIVDFTSALQDTPPIFHAVKFEDPLLRAELAERADEIFRLEMKLRRVLSILYLHAYKKNEPFDLLVEETVQPLTKEKPEAGQMKAAGENQFFHLTFGQYVGLNKRPDFKLPALVDVIQSASDFDSFKAEVTRRPVENEDDSVLLAGLKERMDAIEKMRNCVAHNRRPTKTVTENYLNARPLLNELLDEYMNRWQTGN